MQTAIVLNVSLFSTIAEFSLLPIDTHKMATTYEYIGDGGLALGGLAYSVWYRFAVNQFAYTLFGAKQGILDKICIKQIYFNDGGGVITVVYKDTFNAVWLEDELFALSEAQAYIDEHT